MLLVGDAPYYGRFGFSAEKTGDLWLPGPYERDRLLGSRASAGALDGARGLSAPTGPSSRRSRRCPPLSRRLTRRQIRRAARA